MKIQIEGVSHAKYLRIIDYSNNNPLPVQVHINGTLASAQSASSARYVLEIQLNEAELFSELRKSERERNLGLLKILLESN